MSSSTYYKQKVEQFSAIKRQLSNLNNYIDNCDTSLKNSKKYLDEIIICNETVDQGVLEENVAITVSNVSSVVTSLISECTSRINEYQRLYEKAYKKEQRQAKLKEIFKWT